MQIWRFLSEKIQQNQSAMLLYVIDNHGSSPGRKGFKMVLVEDGEFEGTIGGGIMEVKLLELARKRLKEKVKTVLIKKQFHDKKHAKNQSGMICSGEQTVALIPLQKEHLLLLQTTLSEKSNDLKIKLTKNGISIAKRQEKERLYKLEDVEDFEVVVALKKAKRVHVFGGGHVGLALSEALSLLDYYVMIYDNRSELNTLQKNTFADEIHVIDYQEVLKVCDFEEEDSVVMVTFSYRTDKLLLQQLYSQNFAYIGMMGSKTKIETLYQELQVEGISYEQVSHIAAPIGVKIHSKTAMEIAFSIAAEMIFERNKNLP